MYTKTSLLNKALQQLGLQDLEIGVYEFLLQERKLNIKHLATKFATNRVRIYQTLDKLQSEGLLTYTKGVSREFNLEPPTKIQGMLKFKEVEASRISQDFNQYLPDLLTNFFSYNQKPTFKIYEGKAQFMGIFNQLLDELKPGDCIMALGEGEDFNEIVYVDYFREWMKQRIAKKLRVKILGRQQNSFLKEIHPNNDKEFRELKFLPPHFKLSEGNIFILKHKIIIWNTIQVQAVVIENKAIAQFFVGIFEGIWATI
ncbi:MAG: helix-turn-helix domain-containing protein [bacterium]